MILDTSALVTVLFGEADAERYLAVMAEADELQIAAPSLVEAAIVVEARFGPEAALDLHALLADLSVEVVPFTEEQALIASRAWSRFGKGRHAAGLNLGDIYAYALSEASGQALLFKGDDFAQTDVRAVRV